MKIEQIGNLDDLKKLKRNQFHELWYIRSLTDGQIAKMYNTTKQEVKKKRKELKLNWFNSAVLYVAGGPQYRQRNLWINKKNK